MLLRIDDADDGTAETLEGCAKAVSELADRGLVAMVEPLPYHREADGSLRLLKDVASLSRAIAIASGLGTTSAYTWLKMPSCDDPEAVFATTTLPCVVLGGVPHPDPAEDLASWGRALIQPVGARAGRGPGAALPARRRGVRRGRRGRGRAACRGRHAVSLLREAHDGGAPGPDRRDHARGRRLGLDRAAGAAAGAGGAAARRDRRVGAVRAAARRLAAGDRRRPDLRARRAATRCSPGSPTSCYVGRDTRRRAGVGRRCRGGAAVVALRARAARRRTAPPRTSRSRCAAPGRPPARSRTSASRASGTTPTSWSAASC